MKNSIIKQTSVLFILIFLISLTSNILLAEEKTQEKNKMQLTLLKDDKNQSHKHQSKEVNISTFSRVYQHQIPIGSHLLINIDSLFKESHGKKIQIYHVGRLENKIYTKFNAYTFESTFWIPAIQKEHMGTIILECEKKTQIFSIKTEENAKHLQTTDTLPTEEWIQDSIVNISTRHIINITCKDTANFLLKSCVIERIPKRGETSNRKKLNLEKAAGIQFTATAQDSCLIISKQDYHPVYIYFKHQKENLNNPIMTDLQIQLTNYSQTNTSKIKHKKVFPLSPKRTILFNTIKN